MERVTLDEHLSSLSYDALANVVNVARDATESETQQIRLTVQERTGLWLPLAEIVLHARLELSERRITMLAARVEELDCQSRFYR